jgi:hypothetical protein
MFPPKRAFFNGNSGIKTAILQLPKTAQKKRSSSLCHFFGGKLVWQVGVSRRYFCLFFFLMGDFG